MTEGGPSPDEDGLVGLAFDAMSEAYAPYSRYRVGAALEAEDGRRFSGCNVENASFPVTICAERVALGRAIVSGARRFRRVAVATEGESPAPPCGMCRQALSEFGVDVEVVSVTADGARARWTLGELLPVRFRLALEGGEAASAEGAE